MASRRKFLASLFALPFCAQAAPTYRWVSGTRVVGMDFGMPATIWTGVIRRKTPRKVIIDKMFTRDEIPYDLLRVK